MASQEGRRTVMLTLVSGVASAYFELLELDERRAIARRTRDSHERTCKPSSVQHAGGSASGLELARANLALRSVTANIPAGLPSTLLECRLAVVQLYKALGGGWSLKDSEWSGIERPGISATTWQQWRTAMMAYVPKRMCGPKRLTDGSILLLLAEPSPATSPV
jgi:hypothetical protein